MLLKNAKKTQIVWLVELEMFPYVFQSILKYLDYVTKPE